MKPELILALIPLVGISISLLVNIFVTRYNLRTELKKLDISLIQNYRHKIIEERIKYYPQLYCLTSEMSKIIKTGNMKIGRQELSLSSLKNFRERLDDVDSKYSIFFSIASGYACKELRLFVYNLIVRKSNINFTLTDIEIKEFYVMLSQFEISLQRDLGLYIIEFKDINNEALVKTHSKLRELIKFEPPI